MTDQKLHGKVDVWLSGAAIAILRFAYSGRGVRLSGAFKFQLVAERSHLQCKHATADWLSYCKHQVIYGHSPRPPPFPN